jgi:hypothetical protein
MKKHHEKWPRFWDSNGSLLKDLHEGDVIILGKDFRADFHFTDVDLTQDFKSIWEKSSGEEWPSECCLLNCKERRSIAVPVSLMNKESMGLLFAIPVCVSCHRVPSSPYHNDSIFKKLKSNVIAVAFHPKEPKPLGAEKKEFRAFEAPEAAESWWFCNIL